MLEKWETFYLMVGSSAAALIGLLFVVVTLNAEATDAGRREDGSRLFLTPVVFHFAMVFLVSTLVLMPDVDTPILALGVAAVGIVGLIFVGFALSRLIFGRFPVPHWTDYVYYGALPFVLYAALLACGIGLWTGAAFGIHGLAVTALALLFLGIRNAWDLATWLAYHRNES